MASNAHSSKRTTSATNDVDDDEIRPYVIVAEIGKGSFATVYKGYHEASTSVYNSLWLMAEWNLQENRQQVAIKTVKRDTLSAKLFDNLQSEIQILKSLSHRHITKLIDIVVRILLPRCPDSSKPY
jgi:serine/threonine-protein kinase ULK2